MAGLLRAGPPSGRLGRFRRPDLRPVGVVRPGAAAGEPGLRAAADAAVRREGGEDRPGQPRPRPALPVRGAAAAARLPGGAAAEAARRPQLAFRSPTGQVARDGSATEPG